MTDKQLSPEAQAIVDAYANTIGYYAGFASMLRELVVQLQYDQSCWDEPVKHMVLDACAILDVADELEGK